MKTVYFWHSDMNVFVRLLPTFTDVYYCLRLWADSDMKDVFYHVYNDDFSYEPCRRGVVKWLMPF